jgi:hypothetical protein
MTVTTSTTTIEGMLTVTIAKHKFTLSGTLAKSAVIVEYHADFADSITLGTLTDIAGDIGAAFGFPELAGEITDGVNQIKSLPVAGPAVADLLQASVRITDLVINTATQTYGVGVALDFSANPPTLLNTIELDSIGIKVTKSKNAPAAPATP